MCIHMNVYKCSQSATHMVVRGNLWEPVSSFHYVGPRDKTQVLRLGRRALSCKPYHPALLLTESWYVAQAVQHLMMLLCLIRSPIYYVFVLRTYLISNTGLFSGYLTCLCHKIISWKNLGCRKTSGLAVQDCSTKSGIVMHHGHMALLCSLGEREREALGPENYCVLVSVSFSKDLALSHFACILALGRADHRYKIRSLHFLQMVRQGISSGLQCSLIHREHEEVMAVNHREEEEEEERRKEKKRKTNNYASLLLKWRHSFILFISLLKKFQKVLQNKCEHTPEQPGAFSQTVCFLRKIWNFFFFWPD